MLTTGGASRARTSHAGTPYSTSSVRNSVKVEDLKRVLSGASPATIATRPSIEQPEDSASDSMMSYDGSDYSTAPSRPENPERPSAEAESDNNDTLHAEPLNGDATEGSVTPRPLTAVSSASGRPLSRSRSNSSPEPEQADEEIPPVPPVPENYASLSPGRASTSSGRPTVGTTTTAQYPSPPQSPSIPALSRPKAIMTPTSGSGPKADSIRSATVRESLRRSISTRDGAASTLPNFGEGERLHPHGLLSKSGWNALDLLESIESDGPSPPPGSATSKPLGGRMKPPY